MSISRTGHCPPFLEYVTRQTLIPRSGPPTPEFVQLTQYSFRWIDIPSYQRGLVWDEELLEELLSSNSVFLGNAILGAFSIPPGRAGFTFVPPAVPHYEVLIDGLQRFSIGTALLSLLHPLVFCENPQRDADAPHFIALKTQCIGFAPVYLHNDRELQHHTRLAVSESYKVFRKTLQYWLDGEFKAANGATLATALQRLFLVRQIAPDSYYGFLSPYEATNTFIGLNTIRVQLSIVDWLRSIIVDQGSRAGWSSADTEEVENRFTEVFTRDGRSVETELVPLTAIVKESLLDPDQKHLSVFPSWHAGLQKAEVLSFLDFVMDMFNADGNPLYREIRCCGAIPFAGLICHFYRCFLTSGNRPSLIKGGNEEDVALLIYLRAYYRVVFDGHVARTRSFVERLLHQSLTLVDVASELSNHFLGRDLGTPVDRDWLVAMLKQADQKRARQVFNACLLPSSGSVSPFNPHRYGTRTQHYQIDHLIPESALVENQPGEPEGRLLMNFAPIRRSANNRQTNLACSQKCAPGGSLSAEVANDSQVHPFVVWLVTDQAQYTNRLDQQRLLQPNSDPPIGDQRIQWLANCLIERL